MKASISSLHHQNTDWLRELSFYKDELTVLNKRLEEVISKNTGQETTARVEHYQNKFILLRERIDTLAHDIKAKENEIEKAAIERPEHITERVTTINNSLHSNMLDFTKNFADTRYEFNTFLADVL